MEVLVNRKFVITLIALFILLAIPLFGQATPESNNTTNATPHDGSDVLSLLMAAEGGGGFTSGPQPTAYAGIKVGGDLLPHPFTWNLDMGYDRLRGHNGFSIATSGMLPVFRYPGPQKNEFKNYLRVYAGPGIGYRTAGGGIGPYLSANVMVALFSDNRLGLNYPSPYIAYQRRFPMGNFTQGDNRVTFGIMVALCRDCGFD